MIMTSVTNGLSTYLAFFSVSASADINCVQENSHYEQISLLCGLHSPEQQ